jgi:hypothetical protein
MAIMSVARLRALIDRLEKNAGSIERLGFVPLTSSASRSASTSVGAERGRVAPR